MTKEFIMQKQIAIGQVIAGKYEVMQHLKTSHLYQWVGAIDTKNQKAYTIQVLDNKFPKAQLKEVFDYFDTLKSIRREGIVVHEQVISNSDCSLAIICPTFFVETLNLSEKSSLELILKCLYEASELLHIVNNKNLIHGQINPNSFVIKDDKIYVSGFGYDPFLMQGNSDALKDCGDFLPSEICNATSAKESRNTIDTYAFAKTVAYWFPNICKSAWYLKATNPDPNQRFKHMRKLFEELKQALTDMFSGTTASEPDIATETIEISEVPLKSESQSSGGISPKYLIQIELDPPEAGRVEGGGKYTEGKQIKLEAIAFPDWEFIGWDGDITQFDKSFNLVVEKDLKIIARYKQLPKAFVSIQIDILPNEAKEFVKVSGIGNHLMNTNVSIHAWSVSPDKYRFSGWEGDINDSTNPFTVSIQSDIKAIARFIVVPDLSKPKPTPTKQLGGAFAQNSTEQTFQLESLPEPQTEQKATISENEDKTDKNKVRSQKHLGSAFSSSQEKETLSPETIVKPTTNKPVIGSAFDQ